MTSPHPFTSTSTPLFLPRSCNSPLRGYITSGGGANTTKFPTGPSVDTTGKRSFSDTPSPRTELLLVRKEELGDDDDDDVVVVVVVVVKEDGAGGRTESFSDIPSPRIPEEPEEEVGRRVRSRSRSRSSVRG